MRPSIIARVPNGKRSADSVDLHEDSLDSMYKSPAKRTKLDVTPEVIVINSLFE